MARCVLVGTAALCRPICRRFPIRELSVKRLKGVYLLFFADASLWLVEQDFCLYGTLVAILDEKMQQQ
jgi:hypothetical protein